MSEWLRVPVSGPFLSCRLRLSGRRWGPVDVSAYYAVRGERSVALARIPDGAPRSLQVTPVVDGEELPRLAHRRS